MQGLIKEWMAYPTEVLDFLDVIQQNSRLLALMEAIELGNIVDLYVVGNALGEPT